MTRRFALVSIALLGTAMAAQGTAYAEEVAPVAPVVPPAPAPPAPVYQTRWDIDGPILAIEASLGAAYLLGHTLAMPFCAPVCDRATLNGIDRANAGVWRPGWSTASDFTWVGTMVGAAGTVLATEGLRAGAQDLIVVSEAVMAAGALQVVTAMAVRRPRPFVYGTAAPIGERLDGDAALSFFSGHTATAFAAAVSMHSTLRRARRGASWPWITLVVGLGAAGMVASGRVLAGKHFVTDVTTGAVVGTSMGLLLPALHDKNLRLAPMTQPLEVEGRDKGGSVKGLMLLGTF